MTYNILIPVGCRSDEGLSAPVIRRLKENPVFNVKVIKLEPQNFITSYQIAEYHCKAEKHIGNSDPFVPDLILITGDRVEMCAAAAAAFHNKVKIAHLYAGVINDPITTFDDVDRHVITLWSDIQFCENVTCGCVTELIKHNAFLKPNVHVVGITHLDDLEIDERLVPRWSKDLTRREYDLILINNPPLTKSNCNFTVIDERVLNIQTGGNPDGNVGVSPECLYYENLPRPQFLGLLKNCRRFITNSSAAIYEAPYFLKPEQIVMVGDRNKNRSKVECKPGGSDRIVKILYELAQAKDRTP